MRIFNAMEYSMMVLVESVNPRLIRMTVNCFGKSRDSESFFAVISNAVVPSSHLYREEFLGIFALRMAKSGEEFEKSGNYGWKEILARDGVGT